MRGATAHNLRDVDVDIPLGVLVVVTRCGRRGQELADPRLVSGRDGVVSIDQAAIKGSRRSNPATYTGLLDPIRKAYAKANGVKPALFQRELRGRLPELQRRRRHLHRPRDDGRCRHHLRGVRGEALPGRRPGVRIRREEHQRGARDGGHRGRGVLCRRRGEEPGRAQDPRPARRRRPRLPQPRPPLPTLSGGERQRLKLATHMGEKADVYVLDEPTTGLHLAMSSASRPARPPRRLRQSVIVIAHHQAVMAHADWIIDLGPGAGHDGRPQRSLRRHTRRPRRGRIDSHRRAPRGLRRR